MEEPIGVRPARTCVVDQRLLPAVFGAISLANSGRFGWPEISLILAALLGGAALLFRNAAGEIAVGTGWASDVCSTSQMFCHHPEYLAYAAGAVLVVAMASSSAASRTEAGSFFLSMISDKCVPRLSGLDRAHGCSGWFSMYSPRSR